MTGDRIDEQEALFARLDRALPRATPPPDLLDRILAEARPEARVVPLRQPVARRLAPVLAAAAAVLVAVLVWERGSEAPVERATIAGAATPSLGGEAVLEGGRALISLHDVPPAPAGHHYEVWVLPRGSQEMHSLGVFRPEDDAVRLAFPLPADADYAAIDISVEEDGGPPEHSGRSLAGGRFD